MSGFILGVDLDGVCGDYTERFRQVVAEDRGIDPEALSLTRSWDFAEWGIDSPEEFDRLHRLAVLEHRMFRHMPAMPGVAAPPDATKAAHGGLRQHNRCARLSAGAP